MQINPQDMVSGFLHLQKIVSNHAEKPPRNKIVANYRHCFCKRYYKKISEVAPKSPCNFGAEAEPFSNTLNR